MGMIHLRVISPADLTEQAVAMLAGDPGVLNLVLLSGRARIRDTRVPVGHRGRIRVRPC